MELLFIIPFSFLLLGGGALVALVVMARTSLRQPAPAKTVGRWLLVLALCAAQVGCWQAADRFGQNVGGGAGTTGLLQWAVIGVATLWLVHQVWRLVRSPCRRSATPD
ncbi:MULTISPECIES: hypothetical protein [unclassified Thiocapsa]|uniref:hypothetical protein n=1 Tax=unclassified Thiocapsa TaxID=2641286 RepID=UPI0035B40327